MTFFHGYLETPPDPATILVVGMWCGPRALDATIPGSLKLIQENLRPRLGVLRLSSEYVGYRTHLNKITEDPSQPGGPSYRGPDGFATIC